MTDFFLLDSTLSAGAKGVFAYIKSLPENKEFYRQENAERIYYILLKQDFINVRFDTFAINRGFVKAMPEIIDLIKVSANPPVSIPQKKEAAVDKYPLFNFKEETKC